MEKKTVDNSPEMLELMEVAQRIKQTRELLGYTAEEMAEKTEVTLDDYNEFESGTRDFNFTFIYKCARSFGVDPTDLLKGTSPTLTGYELTKKGAGLPITRRAGYTYKNLASLFKTKFPSRSGLKFLTATPTLKNRTIHSTKVRKWT